MDKLLIKRAKINIFVLRNPLFLRPARKVKQHTLAKVGFIFIPENQEG